MAYHLSISIRLKTRAEIQPILDALEPVGIYPDEDDIYQKGGFSYVDHLAWDLFYSKERCVYPLFRVEEVPGQVIHIAKTPFLVNGIFIRIDAHRFQGIQDRLDLSSCLEPHGYS